MRRLPSVACVVAVACAASALGAQNSTRKDRPEPSPLAARAGSAVQWREDVDGALAEAKERGKPVFWYVPTVDGSPMDRTPEIDRYLMAGPFSWPTTVALLNEGFVPLKVEATREQQKRFGLQPRKFVEPGYVVLDADGKELARLDEITTFERVWFETPLAKLAGREVGADSFARFLVEGAPRDVEPRTESLRAPGDDAAAAERAAFGFLRGAAAFNDGDPQRARELWGGVAAAFPDEPLAWKAAAESEGHGPYRYGFEVLRTLPAAAIASPHDGSRAPDGAYTEDELRRIGAAFLRRMRDARGGLTDSRYDFGGADSMPNVWTAVTAIAGWALLRERFTLASEEVSDSELHANAAGDFAIPGYATDDANLNLQDEDELVWAVVYRLRLECAQLDYIWSHLMACAPPWVANAKCVDLLVARQQQGGAWRHEYANPFVTAAVLVAIADAKRHRAVVPANVIERGVAALLACRAKNAAFTYGQVGRGEARATVEAAHGRMAYCELALLLHGASDQAKLCAAIDAWFAHHALLAEVRKYDDHANRHAHGGFFFWFDVHGCAEAIAAVTDAERRARYAADLRKIVLALPEIDGTFVDSHELGKCYGTAMALLTLATLR